MATNPKITTIGTSSQHEARDKTLAGIRSFADSRRTLRATSDKLTKARDTILSAFENRVLSGSDTVKSALSELRAYRLIAPATSISTGDPVKLAPVPLPTAGNTTAFETEVRDFPHDDVWVWGNQGKHEKDKTDGLVEIWGACGNASLAGVPTQDDNHLEGATGIVDFITSDKRAYVNVTATISNVWQYGIDAHGAFSSADAKGGIDMAAFLDGNPIDGPRRLELFSDSVNDFNQVTHSGSGVANVLVSFTIQAGQVVGLPFGAWLVCDHSSGLGSAGALGIVRCQILRLTIVKFFF